MFHQWSVLGGCLECTYSIWTDYNKYIRFISTLWLTLTMLEQALAKVMNLGLNCRQVTGPVCFPSRSATFIPLSAFHTWIFPSSDPGKQNVETGITLCELISSPFWIYWWRLTDHGELRVRRERGLQNDTFTVVIALQWRRKTPWDTLLILNPNFDKSLFKMTLISHPKWVEHCSFESVQHSECSTIGGDQNELSVVAELETRPLTCSLIL